MSTRIAGYWQIKWLRAAAVLCIHTQLIFYVQTPIVFRHCRERVRSSSSRPSLVKLAVQFRHPPPLHLRTRKCSTLQSQLSHTPSSLLIHSSWLTSKALCRFGSWWFGRKQKIWKRIFHFSIRPKPLNSTSPVSKPARLMCLNVSDSDYEPAPSPWSLDTST